MNLINDIYYRVGTNLMEQNFEEANIEEKKNLINTELKKYIICKLHELNKQNLISENQNELSVNELLLILSTNIPKEDHFNTLSHFTHYILQVASNLQGWSIVWLIEDDESLVDNPLLTYNENGLLDSLTTAENTDYVKTFNFVYDIFNNSFMLEKHPKRLTLIPQVKE